MGAESEAVNQTTDGIRAHGDVRPTGRGSSLGSGEKLFFKEASLLANIIGLAFFSKTLAGDPETKVCMCSV